MGPILKVDNLSKVFLRGGQQSVTAVKNVSFELMPGECLGVLGESGSGKTTMVSMITRLLDVTVGQIILDGQNITNLRGKELRSVYRKMQMVFQTPADSFDPRKTLGDGIGESLRNVGMSRRETRAEVERLLEQCELSKKFADRYPHQVSGGQCQRAAIARALAIQPKLLICDEATGALDVSIQNQIAKLLVELVREQNMGCIFIGHDLALVRSVTQRIAVMYLGRIVELLDSEDLEVSCRHPYTRALLNSVFDVYCDQNEEIQLLQGEPPSPLQMPEGCPFAPRCPKCTEECRRQIPVLRTIEDGHDVACHYAT